MGADNIHVYFANVLSVAFSIPPSSLSLVKYTALYKNPNTSELTNFVELLSFAECSFRPNKIMVKVTNQIKTLFNNKRINHSF
jgi:hypothetical protein